MKGTFGRGSRCSEPSPAIESDRGSRALHTRVLLQGAEGEGGANHLLGQWRLVPPCSVAPFPLAEADSCASGGWLPALCLPAGPVRGSAFIWYSGVGVRDQPSLGLEGTAVRFLRVCFHQEPASPLTESPRLPPSHSLPELPACFSLADEALPAC